MTIQLTPVTAQRTNGVADTFVKAVNAFNTQDWKTVGDLLYKDIVVYNISHLNYVLGHAAVMKYFNGLPKDKPVQFDPSTMTLDPGVYPVSVHGVALWSDPRKGHINRPIKYNFLFDPANFLITSLWAQHSQ
jgi:hypothetical protein